MSKKNEYSNPNLAAIGYASIIAPIPKATFASQMLSGGAGDQARRRSSALLLSTEQMQRDMADIMEGLSEEDFEDDSSDESDDGALAVAAGVAPGGRRASIRRASVGGRRGMMNKTLSRKQMHQYGVFDETTENMFIKTMGMDEEASKLITAHTSRSGTDIFNDMKVDEKGCLTDPYNLTFVSKFPPDEMRCLALVAHNHMKPAMKDFVATHKEVLRKFRLTGTNTTMTMLKDAFGEDSDDVQYGPSFQSGPLGGDAELCALMCLEDLGGVIFFQDPLSAHPHQADIDSLVRLCNVHNILTATNPCTAHALCFVLKCALESGRKDKVPSFFASLKSPGVAVYKEQQRLALEAAKKA